MQSLQHLWRSIGKPSLARLLPALLSMALSCGPSLAAMGSWVEGDHVRARLAIAGLDRSVGANVFAGTLELVIAPGWKTYWRTPGVGGIPPRFDFSASRNLVSTRVLYPPPHRFDEGFGFSNVYTGRVILPLELRLADPSQMLRLDLKLDLGICERVCVPVQMHLGADGALADDFLARAVLLEARQALPLPAARDVFFVDRLGRSGGSDAAPEFEIAATIPPSGEVSAFVEGPPAWFASVPEIVRRQDNQLRLRFTINRQESKLALREGRLLVTLIVGDRAIEQEFSLDGNAALEGH